MGHHVLVGNDYRLGRRTAFPRKRTEAVAAVDDGDVVAARAKMDMDHEGQCIWLLSIIVFRGASRNSAANTAAITSVPSAGISQTLRHSTSPACINVSTTNPLKTVPKSAPRPEVAWIT